MAMRRAVIATMASFMVGFVEGDVEGPEEILMSTWKVKVARVEEKNE